jgi:hypothetical protein
VDEINPSPGSFFPAGAFALNLPFYQITYIEGIDYRI